MGWILLGIIALIALWAIGIYNGLVQLRVRAEGSWSDIDVQLKRRYDLIPNLVETVKGYASHEQKVFQQVTDARAKAMQAGGPEAKGQAELGLSGALKSLFAVAEAYPQLRASENFQGLQGSLTEIEAAIQNARRYYNAVVRDYNTKLEVVPDRFVASIGGFTRKEFFQPDSPEERKNVKVSF
ncbi:MAG: LemA family protein [Candidatus Omnitrophica bacterium]|nr:LemA family protein [Candidatus Omnitrophota bacterium]